MKGCGLDACSGECMYYFPMEEEYFGHFESGRPPSEASASEEALGFIRRLPRRFVDMQIDAVSKAIEGDSSSLNRFRRFCLFGSPKLDGVDFYDEHIPLSDGEKMRIRVYRKKEEYACDTDKRALEGGKSSLILYFHGGGWCINGVESCMRICQDYALRTGAVVVACDYRLSPEYPYPVPNNDCLDCLKWACENADKLGIDKRKIFLSGDSAGGGLALSTALMLEDFRSGKISASELKDCKIGGIMLFYPAVDVDNTNRPSYELFGKNFCLDADLMRLFARAYAPDEAIAKSPYASPIKADFKFGFPVLVVASECDILHDEAAELALKLSASGIKTRYVCLKSATHIYITRAGMDEAYAKALQEACSFVKRALDTP